MGESPDTTDSRIGGGDVGQDTAVIGVVIAGLLSAFLVPGPFDLGSMMIGLLLLVILGAYADLTPASFRHAVGTAAAGAFAGLYLLGHWLDAWLGRHGAEYWLSGWPRNRQKLDDFQPDADGGGHLLVVWLILTGLLLIVIVAITPALRERVAAAVRGPNDTRQPQPGPQDRPAG